MRLPSIRKSGAQCECTVCTLSAAIIECEAYDKQLDARVRIATLSRIVACEIAAQRDAGYPHSPGRMIAVFAHMVAQELAALDPLEPTTLAPVENSKS